MEPYTEHTVDDFMQHDLGALMQKRIRASMAVQAAREGLEEGDSRGQRALDYYLGERKRINQAIQHKRFGEAGPPAQAIGLKPVSMAGAARTDRNNGGRQGVVSMDDVLAIFK